MACDPAWRAASAGQWRSLLGELAIGNDRVGAWVCVCTCVMYQ
jgi:hypothetical protein